MAAGSPATTRTWEKHHHWQSYLGTPGGPTLSAYTGIGLYSPPLGTGAQVGTATPAGTLQQFEGTVSANGASDAFFTGLLQLPPAPQPALVVQAFAKAPGQMTVQPRAVECVTEATGAGATTRVQIADLFVTWPGVGSVSASITSAGLLLQTSPGGPNLGTLAPPVTGHDDLTRVETLSFAPAAPIGVYGSLLHTEELYVLTQDPALGVAVVTLELTAGSWTPSAPQALAGFSTAQQQAMGLFGQGGCFTPPPPLCVPGPVARARTAPRRPVAAPRSTSR